VRRAVEKHGAPVNSFDAYGIAPIHYASRRGSKAVTECLIELGADVNLQINNENQEFPIFYAIGSGSVDTVHTLVTAGANLEQLNASGLYPLQVALKECEQPLIAAYLIQATPDLNQPDLEGT
jgi:ankyrin repeat protein